MTNNDQSNQNAASPTNSEAVRCGDWLAELEADATKLTDRADVIPNHALAEYLRGMAMGIRCTVAAVRGHSASNGSATGSP